MVTTNTSDIKTYSPQYYIRIFPRIIELDKGGEVINPTNVFSIRTSKDIYSAAGTWSIEFDYRDGKITQDSWFFRITPMDYVEIYMRREPRKDGRGFGVFDANDNWVGTFEEVAVTYSDLPATALQTGVLPQFGLSKTRQMQRPLTVYEKIWNKDFVYCGYVDRITNKFSISETGPQNRIILEGRGVEKFLQEHNFYFNFMQPEKTIEATVTAGLNLSLLRPANAVFQIMAEFLPNSLTPTAPTAITTNTGSTIVEGATYKYKIVNEKIKTGKKELVTDTKGRPVLKNGKKVYKDEVIPQTQVTIWQAKPSLSNIWFGLVQPGSISISADENSPQMKSWGRMYNFGDGTTRAIGNLTEGPFWSILQQFTNSALNEFWIDETGNMVLRACEDAWTRPESLINPDDIKKYIGTDLFLDQFGGWIKIKSDEIHNWEFIRSDNQLKTLVLDMPISILMGSLVYVVGQYGVAPLTEDRKRYLISSYQQTIDNPNSTQDQKDDAKKAQIFLQQYENLKIDTFPLDTANNIYTFWRKFGIRPIQVSDLYSQNVEWLFKTAQTVFKFYLNSFWEATAQVRGDTRFKVGHRVYFSEINAVFYCHSVEHDFVWGEGWTTTLKLTRGEIYNTSSSSTTELQLSSPTSFGLSQAQLQLSNQINQGLSL